MKKITLTSIIAATCLLSSCASIVNGNQESVSVKTGEVHGATCSLENNKGKWYINQTPGSVTVSRSYQDLKVACQKSGYGISQKNIASHTKGMAFGNVLFGGVIGAGVDMADGAAYDYPTDISIPLSRAHA